MPGNHLREPGLRAQQPPALQSAVGVRVTWGPARGARLPGPRSPPLTRGGRGGAGPGAALAQPPGGLRHLAPSAPLCGRRLRQVSSGGLPGEGPGWARAAGEWPSDRAWRRGRVAGPCARPAGLRARCCPGSRRRTPGYQEVPRRPAVNPLNSPGVSPTTLPRLIVSISCFKLVQSVCV